MRFARSRHPHRRPVLLLALVLALNLVGIAPAAAHTPHDVAVDVALSPDFQNDRTVYAIMRAYLLKSEDSGTTWTRLVNGLDGDHALSAVAVSAQDEQVLFVGTRGDGVFRSDDAGRSWKKATGDLPGKSVFSLTLSPHDSAVAIASIAAQGVAAVYQTTDSGRTWAELPGAGPAGVIAFAPDDPDAMFSGSPDGVVRSSSDGGATWAEILKEEGSGPITSIAVSPTFSTDSTVFVTTRAKGLFLSVNGGRSFSAVNQGETGAELMSVALSPQFDRDGIVWVSSWSGGAFLSSDAGSTWSMHDEGLTTNVQADELGVANYRQIRMSSAAPGDDPTVFLAGFDGLFRTTDSDTWEELETQASGNIAALAVSPRYGDDHTLAVGTYVNGVHLSDDGGETWTPINDGLATRFEWTRQPDYIARLTGVWFSPSFGDDDTLFAGIRGYILRSQDRGERWVAESPEGLLVKDEFPADFTLSAFSPTYDQDQTLVVGTDGGKVFKSTDGGDSYQKVGQLDLEFTALVASPAFADDHTVVAGTPTGVHRSTDEGTTWEPAGLPDQEIYSLAISPAFADDQQMFAGTPHGLFVTTDGGDEWKLVTGDGLDDSSVIEAVVTSPSLPDDHTVLVSVKGRGLVRSVDGGATFTSIAPDLLRDNVVLSSFYHPTTEPIVFSPDYATDQTIFGIAETTVYKSTDGGDTWTAMVPPVTLHDIDEAAAPSPLLPSARFEPDDGRPDDRGFDTPIGRLSARRVLAAGAASLVALAAMTLLRRRSFAGRRPFASLVVRVGLAVIVLAVGLVVLAA